MAAKKPPFHEQVATRIIRQLEEGTAPFQKPWEPGSQAFELPYNPTTGNRYRGINSIQLLSEGRNDPRWMTYKQAQAVDAQVSRGEKGTTIQYWKFNEEKAVRGADGKPVKSASGKTLKDQTKLDRPRVFFASVFNAEQITGLPDLQKRERPAHEWDRIERAEHILKASGAIIHHKDQSQAFYSPGIDAITLPLRSQFKSQEGYYATAIHELGHWTGHDTRLNRDLSARFGTEGYAREELRAEIGSMMVNSELALGHDPSNHVAYVASWIKALKQDPLEIFRAAADAEKISDYVLSFERGREQDSQASQEAGKPDAERSVQALTIEALAGRFVDAKTNDPEMRTQIKAAIGAELAAREKAGTLPNVSVSTDRAQPQERTREAEKSDEVSR